MLTRPFVVSGAIVAGLFFSAMEARADIPPPPPRLKTVPFEVKVDYQAQQARLQIPSRLLNQKGTKRVGDARPAHQTWIAGLALSVAVGSVFFLRRGGRARLVAAAVMVAAGLFLLAGQVWANGAPPFAPGESDEPALPPGLSLPQDVVLEVVPRGDRITLFVPFAGVDAPTAPAPLNNQE